MKKIIIKILSSLLYKLNKTTSFNEMYEKLLEYAQSNDENYVHLRVGKNVHEGFKISAYINNFNWVEGDTIDECIEKLEKYKNRKPEEGKINEVLI